MPGSLSGGAGLNVLVLGWSSIARRRVLPALVGLGHRRVDVASRTGQVALPDGVDGRAFRTYETALDVSDAELVYVSTRNHEHASLAAAALESGRHVVVDKPATLACPETRGLADLAAARGRLVAEATVWPWHPQIDEATRILAGRGPAARLVAAFSFPRLAEDDFRLRAAAGGGVLWDLGPYAVSMGRVFFGTAPEEIVAVAETRPGDEVETAFTALMRYPDDRVAVGHFGMTTAYINRLDVLGPRVALALERAFTTPPDRPCRVTGERDGERFAIDAPAADAFARFLAGVVEAAASGRHQPFAEAMLADAAALDRLRAAALDPAGGPR